MTTVVDELIAVLGFDLTGEVDAKRFQQRLENLNDKLDDFATAAGQMAAVATGAVAAAFAFLGKSVVDTNAQFQTYQATLETIEGTAEKAKTALDWVAQFGKTTPYEVSQVTEAFVALKAYGIDPIVNDTLRRLGDTASAMNKPLMQAVEAFADAATGEFERLKEFGIKSKTEGDNVTFSWTKNGEELTETVKKSAGEIKAFLLETLGDRFAGAMDRQSKTWGGMMSNLADVWVDFRRRIGDKGFFTVVNGYLKDLLGWIAKLDGDGTLDRWAANLSATFTATAETVRFLTIRMAENVAYLADNFDELRGPLIGVGLAIVYLMARAFPLISIVSTLAFVVDDFLAYMQGGESIIGDFITSIQEMTGVSEGVAQVLTGMGGTVIAALSSALLFAPSIIFKLFGKMLVTSLSALAPLVMKGAVAAFALLSNPIGWAAILAGVAGGLVWYFWDDLKSAWGWLDGKVPGLADMLGDWFRDASWFEIFVKVTAGLPLLFLKALTLIIPSIKSDVVALFQNVFDWLMEIKWFRIGYLMAVGILEGLQSVGDSIAEWFTGLIPDWAKDWFDEGSPQQQHAAHSSAATGARIAGEDQAMNMPFGQRDTGLSKFAGSISAEQAANISAMLERNRLLSIKTGGSGLPGNGGVTNVNAPSTTTVTVHQTVTRAADAPQRAADATAAAIADGPMRNRAQAGRGSAF